MRLTLIEGWLGKLWSEAANRLAILSAALTAIMVQFPAEWARIMEDMPWWAKALLILIVYAAPASTQVVKVDRQSDA